MIALTLVPRWLTAASVIGLVLVLSVPVATRANTAPCRVRNVTQDTVGPSFNGMVRSASDGDRLRVRGTCEAGALVKADLTILGAGEERAILSGRDRHRVLRIATDAVVVLRHLRIVRGRGWSNDPEAGSWPGGGILTSGTLTLIDSVVARNHTGEDEGGGIYNSGRLTLIRSSVRRNRADWGGGIAGGDVTIRESRLVGNHAVLGGAIRNANVTLEDSIVTENSATSEGGGLHNVGGSILRTAITENRAYFAGGGVAAKAQLSLVIEASTLSGNSASYRGAEDAMGGGLYVSRRATVSLLATTVTGNVATGSGGGVYVGGANATFTLDAASSVTGNGPDDCVGTLAC
jgi:hypothetical protein